MKHVREYFIGLNSFRSFRIKWFITCVLLLTIIDFFSLSRLYEQIAFFESNLEVHKFVLNISWLFFSFFINIVISIVYFYVLPNIPENKNAIFWRVLKIVTMILTVIVVTSIRHYCIALFSENVNISNFFSGNLVIQSNFHYLHDVIVKKCLIFLLYHFIYQLGQKYSPGFFLNMALGKYSTPKNEERIIMFIDLKDSTPISEKLGHQKYFQFIKEFIYNISNAAHKNDGDIYQYVGDEVIVTWAKEKRNNQKCINTLVMAQKFINKKANFFKENFGIVPEFRVGIHAGEVTVGEIGVIKKELAMSGEAMNITARIRSACSELNQKYIVSEDYFNYTHLQQWQGDDLGEIPLKGIETRNLKLYGLKI